jgi:hypothetical protein
MFGWESDSCLECVAPRADLCRSLLPRVRQANPQCCDGNRGERREREGETSSVGILQGEGRDVEMQEIKKNDSEKPKEENKKSKTKKQNRLLERHLGILAFFLILERDPAGVIEVF